MSKDRDRFLGGCPLDAVLLVYQEDLADKVGLDRFLKEGGERVGSALDEVIASDDPFLGYETPDGLFACECVATRFGHPPPTASGSFRPQDIVGTMVRRLKPLDLYAVRQAIDRVAKTVPFEGAVLDKAKKAVSLLGGEYTGLADDFGQLSFNEKNDKYSGRRLDNELRALFRELSGRLERASQ
ncbi:MAG: hypothetical protein AAF366_13645 [Pseudomonadota bacterium]